MINVENLSKTFVTYKKEPGFKGAVKSLFSRKKELKTAVDQVNFRINEGEMVGYIGANGAGKSTTIKMMTGILVPSAGECTVGGLVPHKDRRRHARQIGVVFGQRTQLWWDLPLGETFGILKEIYEVSPRDYAQRMAFFNEVLELQEFIKEPVRTLSLGQRMRADLAASLLHQPRVLFLDEPTIGLDVVVKERIIQAIREINAERKTTVILTTHDLQDIEELCSRIIVIDKGKMVYDGNLENLKTQYGQYRTLQMDIKLPEVARSFPLEKTFGLGPEAIIGKVEDNSWTIRFDRNQVRAADILARVMGDVQVLDMKLTETPIEEIVKKIYSGKLS